MTQITVHTPPRAETQRSATPRRPEDVRAAALAVTVALIVTAAGVTGYLVGVTQ